VVKRLSLLPLLPLLPLMAGSPAAAAVRVAVGSPRAPAAAYGFDQVHPAWLQGGFWMGRPWPAGWYRAAPARWSVEGLASVSLITEAVNGALAQGLAAIQVPGTTAWLNFASVEALPNGRITFVYSGGAASQRAVGECQLGLLDSRPALGLGLHLLNAACGVAYGRGV
jgi:hypothetical protein